MGEGSLVIEGGKIHVSSNLSATDQMLQRASLCICTAIQLLGNFCQTLFGTNINQLGQEAGWNATWLCVVPIPHPWIHLGSAPYWAGPIWISQVRKLTKSACESRKTRSEWKNYIRSMKKVILLYMSDTFDSFCEQAFIIVQVWEEIYL